MRFVTHAGIDGYSRLITFIKCSTNSKAETMYNTFMKGVQRFGLPSRVRTDQGRENIEVARYMLRHRGCNRSFADSWNHHGLRTAHNDSPLQLYATGYLQLIHMDVPALDFLQDVNDEYSLSEEGMPQGNHDDSEVVVPETSFMLNQ